LDLEEELGEQTARLTQARALKVLLSEMFKILQVMVVAVPTFIVPAVEMALQEEVEAIAQLEIQMETRFYQSWYLVVVVVAVLLIPQGVQELEETVAALLL
jgi:surface polysaccharide O-acyltransferase-like enzyme